MSDNNGFIRFFNCSIPVTGCNLRCDYCYLIQRGNEKALDFKETSEGFDYSVDHMIKALYPNRLGGICAFHICGDGETLLWTDICKFAYGLFEMGHYVSFTSNCTYTKVIDELINFPLEFRKKMFFKCSFHYREFKRLGLLERFAQNVNKLADANISYSVEIVTNDYVLDNIDEIISFSVNHFGAKPHVLTQRSELIRGKYHRMQSVMDVDTYGRTWDRFDSPLFEYQQEEFERHPTEFCYAGVYSLQMHLKNGNVFPCPGNKRKLVNLFENIDEQPVFAPVGHNCPLDNCWFGFVTHVMGGVERERTPKFYFKDFRDRERCDDGRHWLSDTMQVAYGCRCADFHDSLTHDQYIYMDNLMHVSYTGKHASDTENARVSKILSATVKDKTYAIYGMGQVGNWIKEIITNAGGKVVYGIDRYSDKVKSDLPVYNVADSRFPDVDTIIVSVYAEYMAVSKMLREKTNGRIVSALELV